MTQYTNFKEFKTITCNNISLIKAVTYFSVKINSIHGLKLTSTDRTRPRTILLGEVAFKQSRTV